MTLDQWLLYLSVVVAIIITPGPSALLCMTHGALHGSMRTSATVLGGMLASLSLMALSAVGLGAAIAASNTLFQVIKFAGALYLVCLGIAIWRSSPPALEGVGPSTNQHEFVPPALPKLFRGGFVVGIGNPKDLLFFGALFPQFLDASAPLLPQLILLALTWLVVDGLAMFAYAAFGAKLIHGLSHVGGGKLFNRVTGSAFIAAGGTLATAQR